MIDHDTIVIGIVCGVILVFEILAIVIATIVIDGGAKK